MRRLNRLRWRGRRSLFLVRLKVQARLKGAQLIVRVDREVQLHAGLRISVDPRTTNVLDIERGCVLHEDVLVILRGGTMRLGPGVSIRRGSILNVTGILELLGDNIISYYNVIHCAEHVRLARYASTNEFCTIVDSRHFHTDDGAFFYENVETAPIDIGRNVWLANKSSVLMGVTVGDEAIVAGHAVVNSDVPAGALVGGIPAKVIRQR